MATSLNGCAANRDAIPPESLSGAERQVRGQLDELCDDFSPDSPFHEGLERPSKAKPQVSSKQVGLFSGMAAHNSPK